MLGSTGLGAGLGIGVGLGTSSSSFDYQQKMFMEKKTQETHRKLLEQIKQDKERRKMKYLEKFNTKGGPLPGGSMGNPGHLGSSMHHQMPLKNA